MRHIIFIILCLLAVSCSSTKKVIQDDLSVSTEVAKDSTVESIVHDVVDTNWTIEKICYDTTVTHITIVRYDTILINGEPLVKERVEVEQVRVAGETINEQQQESKQSTGTHLEDVSYKDSTDIEKHENTSKEQTKRGVIVWYSLILVIGLLSFVIWRVKRS